MCKNSCSQHRRKSQIIGQSQSPEGSVCDTSTDKYHPFGYNIGTYKAAAGSRNYTVLTLEMLAMENPGAVLYLAIGSDMLLSFEGWHRWQDILRIARVVVTSRDIGDAPALHAKAKQLDPAGGRILFAPVQALPMSSSQLRVRLAAGEECEAELPETVRSVIRREGLYRNTEGSSR